MSSMMISNYTEFNEKFQNNNEISTSDLAKRYINLLGRHSIIQDQPAANINSNNQLSAVRRHSSNGCPRPVSKQPQLAMLVKTAQRNLLKAMIAANNLETLAENEMRTRAMSECAPGMSLEAAGQDQSLTSRYKTELCRPFEENGKCKYGEKCQFAHGKHELRHMVRHPKYKTELCRTYHTSGLCPYGSRCHFIHNQAEAAMENQRLAMKHQQAMAAQAQMQNKPGNLHIMPPIANNHANAYSYSPPQLNSPSIESSLPFFGGHDAAPLSPISPVGKGNFAYSMGLMTPPMEAQRYRDASSVGLDNRRSISPPLNSFDLGLINAVEPSDDSVFRSMTPPDSDRESATGSPPGFGVLPQASAQQRLPIFRCLSQS